MNDFEIYHNRCCIWVDKGLHASLDTLPDTYPQLASAMRYSVFNGGKRIRPMLVDAACRLASGRVAGALPAACAVELIHSFSLIHDDLPAMDNDDMRRGIPSCHKAFNESLAVLAGDALHSLAFEMLATTPILTAEQRLQQLATLTQATGCMISGQSMDMDMTGHLNGKTLSQLETMHYNKTGALISASLTMGAQVADADEAIHALLLSFGRVIGLAFQVRDDILDVISSREVLGKTQGSDEALGKLTYISLLGMDKAQKYLSLLSEQAKELLSSIKETNGPLAWLTDYVTGRMS